MNNIERKLAEKNKLKQTPKMAELIANNITNGNLLEIKELIEEWGPYISKMFGNETIDRINTDLINSIIDNQSNLINDIINLIESNKDEAINKIESFKNYLSKDNYIILTDKIAIKEIKDKIEYIKKSSDSINYKNIELHTDIYNLVDRTDDKVNEISLKIESITNDIHDIKNMVKHIIKYVDRDRSENKEHNWECKNCHRIIRKTSEPEYGYCNGDNSSYHNWYKL